jgi:hypothetical protein
MALLFIFAVREKCKQYYEKMLFINKNTILQEVIIMAEINVNEVVEAAQELVDNSMVEAPEIATSGFGMSKGLAYVGGFLTGIVVTKFGPKLVKGVKGFFHKKKDQVPETEEDGFREVTEEDELPEEFEEN